MLLVDMVKVKNVLIKIIGTVSKIRNGRQSLKAMWH